MPLASGITAAGNSEASGQGDLVELVEIVLHYPDCIGKCTPLTVTIPVGKGAIGSARNKSRFRFRAPSSDFFVLLLWANAMGRARLRIAEGTDVNFQLSKSTNESAPVHSQHSSCIRRTNVSS